MKPVIFFFVPNKVTSEHLTIMGKNVEEKFKSDFIPVLLTSNVDEVKVIIYDDGVIHEIN